VHRLTCDACGKSFEHLRATRRYCGVTCRNRANSAYSFNKLEAERVLMAWSCGGGVQSSAIAGLIVAGDWPKPDLAYMTDCGWEPSTTWSWVNGTLRPRLAEVGVELVVLKTADWSSNDMWDSTGHLRIPAHRHLGDGRMAKFHTHCCGNWKIAVARRWLRSLDVKRCEQWIGISWDERSRQKSSGVQWATLRYPLLERRMTREDCLYYLGAHGWPRPPRTSCVMCPQKSAEEWRKLREESPVDWEWACRVDEEIRARAPDVYLLPRPVALRELD
jgi:hypothetical protein